MKVGVIIPVYNARPWIESMLRSIRLQSHKETYVYLSEDHSDDGTWEFLRETPYLYDGLVRNEMRAGWHGGLNNAAEQAIADGCDAIFTASADDMLHRHCVELCLQEMNSNDRHFVVPYVQQFGAGDVLQVSLDDVTVEDLVAWPSMTDKALIRTSVWESVGGYSLDVCPPGAHGVAEDWEFWIKCWKVGLFNYGVVKKPLYFMRVHPGQLSNTREQYHPITVELFRSKHPELPWTEESGTWPPRHRQHEEGTEQ